MEVNLLKYPVVHHALNRRGLETYIMTDPAGLIPDLYFVAQDGRVQWGSKDSSLFDYLDRAFQISVKRASNGQELGTLSLDL